MDNKEFEFFIIFFYPFLYVSICNFGEIIWMFFKCPNIPDAVCFYTFDLLFQIRWIIIHMLCHTWKKIIIFLAYLNLFYYCKQFNMHILKNKNIIKKWSHGLEPNIDVNGVTGGHNIDASNLNSHLIYKHQCWPSLWTKHRCLISQSCFGT